MHKKRLVIPFLTLGLMASTYIGAMAHGGENTPATKEESVKIQKGNSNTSLTVLVNGVEVVSTANHIVDQQIYDSVKSFADLFEMDYTYDQKAKTITINNKVINNIRMESGIPTAWIRDLAAAVDAQAVSWDGNNQECYVLVLPKGTVQIDPHVVPNMGEHWANPEAGDLPTGPIYGVYEGKLVFLEYMIAQEDFIQGKNHQNSEGMKGVPMPKVVQVDIEFQPEGHPGFEVPHYDIHNYFISDEEQQSIE